MTILAEILAAKRARLAAGELAGGPAADTSDGDRFAAALRRGGPRVIAEIKHRSPSAGEILPEAGRRIEEVARAYRRAGAAAISVVVEQDFFGGDPSWIARAKRASGLPVLMKDFVVDERQLDQALGLDADAVLLIAAALGAEELPRLHAAARARGLAVLVEVRDDGEARRALAAGAEIVGVNARDLRTFRVDLGLVARLGRALPREVVHVAESGIASFADVTRLTEAGYGAFLVGESLLRRPDPARALRALMGEGTTEIKICGVTLEQDVDALEEHGVDWVGLNFSPLSPRRVNALVGRALRDRAMRFAKGVVAVFAGNDLEQMAAVTGYVRPDVIQVGGVEPALAGPRVWRTVRMAEGPPLLPAAPFDALLFDTAVNGMAGGTGVTFPWERVAALKPPRPFVLAGGLRASNVQDAIRTLRPDVVDVASGIETAPGVKDPRDLAAFVAAVRGVPDEAPRG